MKKMKLVTAVGCCCVLALSVMAQQKKKEPGAAAKGADTSHKLQIVTHPVTLGHSDLSQGNIPKHTFDSLMRQGLKGGAADVSRITGFDFSYKERSLVEDSVGRMFVAVDLYTEHCFGDTLSSVLRNNIYERTKKGDTVYFDNIRVQMTTGRTGQGRSMKFVIQ